jgi:protein gp37
MTAIEWTHRPGTIGVTWNPIRAINHATGKVGHFCVHESAGCAHCYAETWQKRLGNPVRYAAQDRDKVTIVVDERVLAAPLAWRKPRTAFVCSMTDLFGDFHDDATIDRVFAAMALAPRHIFIVLTKRSARMRAYMTSRRRSFGVMMAMPSVDETAVGRAWDVWPLPNVWLGVSVEDQATADRRIPDLLTTPAALRFISAEPLLGPIDLTNLDPTGTARPAGAHGISTLWREGAELGLRPMLDWVIVGGESGAEARPMHPDWARGLRDQCQAGGVPFFFKQWGSCLPGSWDGEDERGRLAYEIDEEHASVDYDDLGRGTCVAAHGREFVRFSHKHTGRLLDGVEWCQFPDVPAAGDGRVKPGHDESLGRGAAHD